MKVKDRVNFTKVFVAESTASIFAFLLTFALSYLVIFILYLFASEKVVSGESFLVSLAFEDWLFTTIIQLSLLIIFLWRIVDYKEEIDAWKASEKTFPFIKLVLIGIGAGFIILIYSYIHDFVATSFLGYSVFPKDVWFIHKDAILWERGLLLLTGTILAPICEELFFREMMFGNMLRNGFTKTAFVFSALMFAICHLEPTYLLLLFIDGLILGLLYKNTHSIIPSIIAHIMVNIFALSFLFC